MANRHLLHKKSAVEYKAPRSGDIQQGEIAVNYFSGKENIFTIDTTNSITPLIITDVVYAGSSTSSAAAATTTAQTTYMNFVKNTTSKYSKQFSGAGGTKVYSSDGNNLVISSKTVPDSFNITGSTAGTAGIVTSVTSGSNGITLNERSITISDTPKPINVFTNASQSTANADTTNETTYLNQVYGKLVKSSNQITGTGSITVTASNAGVLTIHGTDTDTHYTSRNVVGSSSTMTGNATTTTNNATFLNHTEDNVLASSNQIIGSGSVTVSGAAGKLTISGNNYYLTGVTGSGNGTETFLMNGTSNLTFDSTHSHTAAQIPSIKNVITSTSTGSANTTTTSATTYLNQVVGDSATSSNQIVGAGGVTVTSTTAGILTISGEVNTDTHYTSTTFVGSAATSQANQIASNGNVHMNHIEEGVVKASHVIQGAEATTVTSDANGNITITSPTVPSIPGITATVVGAGNVITTATSTGHTVTLTKGITVPSADDITLVVSNTSTGTVNTATSMGSTYLNQVVAGSVKSSHQIVGQGSVNVTGSTAGVITIEGYSSEYTADDSRIVVDNTAHTIGFGLPIWSGTGVSSLKFGNNSNTAAGQYGAAFGISTQAGKYALSEGCATSAYGDASHAEGNNTYAILEYSHAEGNSTSAQGQESHSEGEYTLAAQQSSHAEGSYTTAYGLGSHAEGSSTYAMHSYSHTEGQSTSASGQSSHAEGSGTTTSGIASHSEGVQTTTNGIGAHSEGYITIANGNYSHAEGNYTSANGAYSHTEGSATTTNSIGTLAHAEGIATSANASASHAEGFATSATGIHSHAEGHRCSAASEDAHAEGLSTYAYNATAPHAEGYSTTAANTAAHAEGYLTKAQGLYSHSEGQATTASGQESHSEGYGTEATGIAAHSEGYYTTASSNYAHAEGYHTYTMNEGELAVGRYNNPAGGGGDDSTLFTVGCGTSSEIKNALEVTKNGDTTLNSLKLTINSVTSITSNTLSALPVSNNIIYLTLTGAVTTQTLKFDGTMTAGQKIEIYVENAMGSQATINLPDSYTWKRFTSSYIRVSSSLLIKLEIYCVSTGVLSIISYGGGSTLVA